MLADWWPDWLTFDGLIKWVHDAFVATYQYFRDGVWATLTVVFGPVATAVTAVGAFLATMATGMGVFSSYLAFANAWVPVDLFFQCVSAYSTLWLALVIYRNVKSWIPTVSGGG